MAFSPSPSAGRGPSLVPPGMASPAASFPHQQLTGAPNFTPIGAAPSHHQDPASRSTMFSPAAVPPTNNFDNSLAADVQGLTLADASQQNLYQQQDDEVHDYLQQLDMLREQCERTGQFVKAQECVNKMRDVNLRHAKKLEERSHQANVDTKSRLKEEHKLELLTFSRMWEEKIAQYDQNAERLITEVKMKHMNDFKEQEGILKVQLMNKRPRFSKKVMDMRALMERCVQQRKYLEAEDVKKKLAVQEQYEIDLFDEQLSVTFEKRIAVLKTQYVNELKAVEQKVKMGREEILSQRQIDFEKLLKRHANVFKELDNETKLHVSKTQRYIHRQVKAMVQDPLKTGMDLRGVSRTLREGNTKKFRSTSRASGVTTPRGGSRMLGGAATTPRGGSSAAARRSSMQQNHDASFATSVAQMDDSRFEW